MKSIFYLLLLPLMFFSCKSKQQAADPGQGDSDTLKYKNEVHLKNLKRLTFGGDNAEAYWSFDDSKLVFQATNKDWHTECDQIYITDWKNDDLKKNMPILVSTGFGRTTCSYFLPGDTTILYASTHEGSKSCPPKPAARADHKYVWPIYSDFDIYVSDLKGNILRKLTNTPGYDAEATVSPKGDRIVFTSLRSGDPELYTMKIDGSDVRQVTNELGYDGGAFFSPDGKKLVFRASRPKTPEDIKEYKGLLAQGLVMPVQMEIFVCNVDGSELTQVTHLGKSNWCPYFLPDGKRIIFSSNHHSDKGFKFNLFVINTDGTGLQQVTFDEVFDAFPVFSNNGKYLVFSSNRHNGGTFSTNLYLGEWVE